MSLKITQHHTADHNWLRDGILTESTRLATPVDIGGPYHLGDPAHIQEHNRTTVALQTLADAAGCAVTLPPERKLGDTGHEGDHLAWEQALAQIQITEGWNDATGGTVTEYADSRGFRWRAHTFTASDTFTVKRNLRPFRVLVVAGGGGGAGRAGNNAQGAGGGNGGAGGAREWKDATLPAKALPVTVGGGGGGGDGQGQPCQGGDGGPSSIDQYATTGGGGGGIGQPGRNGGSGGGGGSAIGNWGGPWGGGSGIAGEGNNGNGGSGSNDGSNAPGGSINLVSDITGTPRQYSTGDYGNPGHGSNWQNPGIAGGPGVVIVAYQVAPYNEATGGTVSEYTDAGHRYRVHTFTNPSDTFAVQIAAKPFRVLVAGGGGGTGYNNSSATLGGGGAGGLFIDDAYVLEAKEYPLTVGAGGRGGYQTYGGGGPSTFDKVTMLGGGAGVENGTAGSGASGGGGGGNNDSDGFPGNGTPGQGFGGGGGKYGGPGGGGGAGGPGQTGTDRYDPQGCQKGLGGPGLPSNIRGTDEVFCAGGRAAVSGVFGGGAFGGCGGNWGNGQPGVVIVSYEIGNN